MPQNYQELNRRSSEHSHLNRHTHHQSIDANTSHDVQIIADLNDQSNTKSDKIISIIAPIHSNSSNLSSSHRSKKFKLHNNNTAQMHNGRRNMQKPITETTPMMEKHFNARHHQSGINHHHKLSHKNDEYNNSSLSDNNIVNVNHRRQTSVEEQFKSKFYGHDIPYPPIDLPVS